jgi:hypothetical protein
LYLYPARPYSPGLGRWLTRDPSEEEGGINLYGVNGNDFVNRYDSDGRALGDIMPGPLAGMGGVPGIPSKPIEWLPYFATHHQIDISFSDFGKMKERLKDIYDDLKHFNHFLPNDGGRVESVGTIAYFYAPGLLARAQYLLVAIPGSTSTYYNAVNLTFNDSQSEVDAQTLPGHILEGQRHWRARILDASPCTIKVETWAHERSANIFVQGTRTAGELFGSDLQITVWSDYLRNIGDYWKAKVNAKPTGVAATRF